MLTRSYIPIKLSRIVFRSKISKKNEDVNSLLSKIINSMQSTDISYTACRIVSLALPSLFRTLQLPRLTWDCFKNFTEIPSTPTKLLFSHNRESLKYIKSF
jgi:hypothetical protein